MPTEGVNLSQVWNLPTSTQQPNQEDVVKIQETKPRQPKTKFDDELKIFNGRRAIEIWKMAMLSMGHIPNRNRHARLKTKEPGYKNKYLAKINFIKSNLTTHRIPGLIWVLDHPGNTIGTNLEDRFIDMLSAIRLMRLHFDDLPTGLCELEEKNKSVLLPDANLNPSTPEKPKTEPPKKTKNLDKLTPREMNNFAALFVHLLHRSFPGDRSNWQLATLMEESLRSDGVTHDGASKATILKYINQAQNSINLPGL